MTEVGNDIDGMTNEDTTKFCGNCQRHVAAMNFIIHSLHCQRNIELCRLCKEPFPTREMEQHLAQAHSRTSCDKCLQPMEQWQLHMHKETCKKRPTSCQYCLLSLPFDEIPEHVDYCGSRTQSCPECRQFVMKKNEKDHQEICTKVQYGNRYQEISSNASGNAFSVIRNTFSTPSIAKKEANDADSSSVERNKKHDYGNPRNPVQDAANRKGSAFVRKALNKDQMNELIEKTKDVFVECCLCNSNVLSSDMKNHLDVCRVNQQFREEQKRAEETSSSLYHGYLPSYEEVVGNARWSSSHPSRKSQLHDEVIGNASWSPPHQSQKSQENYEVVGNARWSPPHQAQKSQENYEVVGNARWNSLSPHPSQESQKQETSESSIQAIMEECPVCLLELPSRLFSDHLQYCSETQTICLFCGSQFLVVEEDNHKRSCASSTQQLPSHFDRMYEQRVHSEESYSNNGKNRSKNKFGHESRTGMGQNSTQLCLEAEIEICPICKSKILSVKFEDHLKCCSEKKMKCHFCNESIFSLDNEDHLKKCYSSNKASAAVSTKQKSPVSPSFSDVVKSSPNASKVNSWSESTGSNLIRDQKYQEPVNRDELQQCPLCDKQTHPADKNHISQCLKKSYVCRFCGATMLRPKFKEHIEAQCKNFRTDFKWKTVSGSGKRGKKNSSKEKNYDDFFVKNTDSDSFPRPDFHDHFSRNRDSNKGAVSAKVEPIMLPCEFCEELVPEEEIILHQSGCRPDLVSYTAKSLDEDDLYGSNLNPSDEPVRRKPQKWKRDDDIQPGEYLFHPSPDAKPIPAWENTSHGSTLNKEVPRRNEFENEHPSWLNRDLPKAENAFNFAHSVAEDKFNPKPLLQHQLEDDNSLERYLKYLNVDSGGESDSKEELNARGSDQRRDQLGKAAQNSLDSSASVECFNDRFCRESAEISNGNVAEEAKPKFAYHANGNRLSNETSAYQKPQEELQHPYRLFGDTLANSNQDVKEKSYYEKKDYHGKQ